MKLFTDPAIDLNNYYMKTEEEDGTYIQNCVLEP
jgi:hypothetical protein